jgi:HPt (histidine-containing phosphotransfer) domain-containing protein
MAKPFFREDIISVVNKYLSCCKHKWPNTGEPNDDDFNNLLIHTFFSEYSNKKTDLHKAIEIMDLQSIKKICHNFKSSLSYIGAITASEAAANLERQTTAESINNIYKKLIKEVDIFKSDKGL